MKSNICFRTKHSTQHWHWKSKCWGLYWGLGGSSVRGPLMGQYSEQVNTIFSRLHWNKNNNKVELRNGHNFFIVSLVCLSVYLFPVFRIVNKTSTLASSAPGIDQLLNTNKVHCKRTLYRGWIKQPSNCSKQNVCTVPDSSPVSRACLFLVWEQLV